MEAADIGELCVSLCFRPISGRLIVTVTKIRGLPKAIADRTGELLQAHLMALRCSTLNTTLNQTLIFNKTNKQYKEMVDKHFTSHIFSCTKMI